MAKKIIGQHDGQKGGNDTYSIPGRGNVSRGELVKEVKDGKHPGFMTTTINGKEYVKGNPDGKDSNNINQ